MKIWFTEIGEPLPIEGEDRLHRYGMLTQELAAYGHEVTWWTSSFLHASKKHIFHEDKDVIFNGVTLRILKGPGYYKNISYRRVRHQRHFAKKFYTLAKNYALPDIIVSPIPTLEVSHAAVTLGAQHRIPVIVDIRDEWPDEFVNMAPESVRWLVRLLLYSYFKKIDYVCKNAAGIIGISKRQMNYGLSFAKRKQGPNDGVYPIGYNPAHMDNQKLQTAKQWWKENGLQPDAFICCFFGTIGNFFDLETVIEAAKVLSAEFRIQFILCGTGSNLASYKKMANNMESVMFPGWVDAPKIAALMELSDVGLAPYYANKESMSLPNKPFEYFAGGLPVVSSIQGELKQFLADHGCGLTYRNDSVEELCEALRALNGSETLRIEMGRRARRLLEEKFSIKGIALELNQHLLRIIQSNKLTESLNME